MRRSRFKPIRLRVKVPAVHGSDGRMSNRRITEWCQDSSTMFKHRPTNRSHTCRPQVFSDWTHTSIQLVRKGTESNGYRGAGPSERVGSVNGQSSHHRVVSGQLHDAQTSTPRPRASVKKLRESHFHPIDA